MYPGKPAADAAAAAPPVTGVPVGGGGGGVGAWSTGLCECGGDCGVFCLACWCPCVVFGRVAEAVDRGATSCGTSGALYALLMAVMGWHCLYSCAYRARMRAQYGLPDDPCCDCCVHFFCEPCSLAQQHRELAARGYDPALGWHLNADRHAAAAAPPAAQHMAGR